MFNQQLRELDRSSLLRAAAGPGQQVHLVQKRVRRIHAAPGADTAPRTGPEPVIPGRVPVNRTLQSVQSLSQWSLSPFFILIKRFIVVQRARTAAVSSATAEVQPEAVSVHFPHLEFFSAYSVDTLKM